jgi:hypothetical protein
MTFGDGQRWGSWNIRKKLKDKIGLSSNGEFTPKSSYLAVVKALLF